MSKYLGLLLLICLIALLASCSSDRQDKSFITGEPCSPPCWYGLELDKSTLEESIAILNDLSFVERKSIDYYSPPEESPYLEVYYSCVYKSNSGCGVLSFSRNNILIGNYFYIGYSLSLSQVLELLGNPERGMISGPIFPSGSCLFILYWEINTKYIEVEFPLNTEFESCKDLKIDPYEFGEKEIFVERIIYTNSKPEGVWEPFEFKSK